MFPLAHLAFAALVGLMVERVRPGRAGRLRWWLLGGILPDLIDKPLALFVPAMAGHGRGVGHALLFVVLLALLALLGLRAEAFRGVAGGAATHLLLDLPWTYAAAFAWPLFGLDVAGNANLDVAGYLRILMKPDVLLGEILGGLVLLVVLVRWVLTQTSLRAAAMATFDLLVVPRGQEPDASMRDEGEEAPAGPLFRD